METKEVALQENEHRERGVSLEIPISDEIEEFENRQMDFRTILAIVVRISRCHSNKGVLSHTASRHWHLATKLHYFHLCSRPRFFSPSTMKLDHRLESTGLQQLGSLQLL